MKKKKLKKKIKGLECDYEIAEFARANWKERYKQHKLGQSIDTLVDCGQILGAIAAIEDMLDCKKYEEAQAIVDDVEEALKKLIETAEEVIRRTDF